MNTTIDTKSMWATRPVRIPKEQGGRAYAAGVCEGIGVRYQIDPTLIRIAFIALFFTSSGLTLYLLCWLLMPKYSVPKAPIEVLSNNRNGTYSSEQTTGWILVITLLFFSGIFSWNSASIFSSTTMFALALGAVSWWALHQRQPVPPAGLIAFPPPTTTDPGTTMTNPLPAPVPDPSAQPPGSQPPGTLPPTPGPTANPMPQPQANQAQAPQAQAPQVDLSGYSAVPGFPAPYNQQKPPAWDPLGAAPELWYLPEPGQVDETLQSPKKNSARRKWLTIGGGVIIACIAASILSAIFDELPDSISSSVGDKKIAVTSEQGLLSEYSSDVGNLNLDLSRLSSLSAEKTVKVRTDVGDATVILPKSVPVSVTCDADVGSTECPAGIVNESASGPTLHIDVQSDVGDVEVQFQD
ncbi:MAG: PspC domain-containing protein [Corynebacterium sp.]|uniref:PspC domain-containing protein n=1 Tax=Corynebacterium sp. TaxID=1720 RepID=UPI0026DAD3E1|nr:PspC domain-containing protein [Corynebacterium sp.]MDO5099824.1 PspC domain-containing protein [Corynebacterium sp.]